MEDKNKAIREMKVNLEAAENKYCWEHRPSIRNHMKRNRKEKWDKNDDRQDNTNWGTQTGILNRKKEGTGKNLKGSWSKES